MSGSENIICACGCGTIFPAIGANGKPRRYFGRHRPCNRDAQATILGSCTPEPNSGCWLWTGCEDGNDGYGSTRIWVNGIPKNMTAHRASYIAFVGNIPSGLNVCHRCDVRTCVNPQHLFLGTQRDNVHDMIRKGRQGLGNTGKFRRSA